mmetsp:Transcript_50740/g.99422  ORF Transcript_50740/g.99422 Transcript_50740/m.99422 type:complete len:704 (+) Transcript_50740:1-2112(+)
MKSLDFLLFCVVEIVRCYQNGVAETPPMGWNSWNHFAGLVSADILKTTADAFVDLGLKDAGYTYINTDDCWSNLARDKQTGRIVPGPNFGGSEAAMKNLSAYIQSKGLKFGIYGAAGETTCAGRAGGLYHEDIDAKTYIDWGAEYLKYDDCGQVNLQSFAKFSAMRDALNRTGVPVVYSYEPHLVVPIGWPKYVGNLWRTGHDIGSNFESMFSELVIGNAWASMAGPGQWNDDDMLEVGNPGLSIAEQRTHFALWCMVKSPLLIGSDVRKIANDSLALLLNKELIAVNQDALGKQAELTAVYLQEDGPNQLRSLLRQAYEPPNTLEFKTGNQAMTTCDYGQGAGPASQVWSFMPGDVAGATRIQSTNGKCLSNLNMSTPLVDCDNCGSGSCDWNVKNANVTLSQISAVGGPNDQLCLKFTTSNGLYLETCNTDPPECQLHRCYYSANLGFEMWYLSEMSSQLIASYTHTKIPPLSSQDFHGPVPGRGVDAGGDDNRRCGTLNGGHDTTSPMCKNSTYDGRLYVSLSEIETRCTADRSCAGFSQDTKDGAPYFRPLSSITSIAADPKWTTWSKHVIPAPTPPSPSPWIDTVDPPYCLATSPSKNPPLQPPRPPAITASLTCSDSHPTLLVFSGNLTGGAIVVGLVNKCSGTHTVTATWQDVGAKPGVSYHVRDLIEHKDLPDASGFVSASVGEHDISVLRLEPI